MVLLTSGYGSSTHPGFEEQRPEDFLGLGANVVNIVIFQSGLYNESLYQKQNLFSGIEPRKLFTYIVLWSVNFDK